MASWLIIIILAYLFFGLASFFDKLVLSGKPNPKSYTFYVSAFSIVAVVLIPFIGFRFPSMEGMFYSLLFAVVHIIGLYTMYVAIKKFDVSKVIATIGATQPIFIFILTNIFWEHEVMPGKDILAFILLLSGSIIISFEKNPKVTLNYLGITLFSSLMFSLDYIFSKFVFISQPFLQGLVWMAICLFLVSLVLLIKKSSREEIFAKHIVLHRGSQLGFISAQLFGGLGNFLQSFAISLAPVAFLATVNSLRGIQYVFLFLITLFVSILSPHILREEISKKVIAQKVISIILIVVGLAIMVAY